MNPIYEEHKEQYEKLADIILEWNEKINVTAIKDRNEFIEKNIIDSLMPMGLIEFEDSSNVMDLGTGGGFPGLPLAIACPDKQFTLVDSVGKKLKVVEDAARQLGLKNVKVVHGRAEDLAGDKGFRERFDMVVSRAVANMSTLSEYCLPFVSLGGYFVAFKTENSEEEIAQAENAIEELGGTLAGVTESEEEDNGHILVIVEKESKTPKKYPRKAGLPSKDPL